MKYLFPVLLMLALLSAAHAQMGLNAPAGSAPRQDMEIYTRNGFLVQQKYTFTNADPTASVNTLSCANPAPELTGQAGILQDPGGDNNYPASLNCRQAINAQGDGFEIVFEDLDTEANSDLVVITDGTSSSFVFSGNTLPAPFFVTGGYFFVRFVSNGNGTVGRGFRLRWRKVMIDNTSPTTPATAFGNSLQFDANKGALVGGHLVTGNAQQVGPYCFSMGYANTANGYASSALGYENRSSGYATLSLGYQNRTNGIHCTAIGYGNTATGSLSSAFGAGASTGQYIGSMALGDYLSNVALVAATASTANNQLTARFNGGYRFISSYSTFTGELIAGAVLAPGSNSWAALSDSTKKEHFQAFNHAEVLGKLSSLRLGSWNYKGQPEQRHYGPMAQDFFARFGHDGVGVIGCDTLLAGHDFTAITLAGVQALIKENEQLKAKLAQTETKLTQTAAKLDQSTTRIDQTNARLEALEALLIPHRRSSSAVLK